MTTFFRFVILFALTLTPTAVPAVDFVIGWELPKGATSYGVALGDVDGDSDVDAIIANLDGNDTLWLNDSTAGFVDSGQLIGTGGLSTRPWLGLLDNDLLPDLWISRLFAGNAVWMNDGTGVFSDSGQSLGASSVRWGVGMGDLDGDGDIDVLSGTDDIGESNRLFLNDGAGVFTDSGQEVGVYWTRSVALGDVDGDDDLDVVFGNNGANRLWLNDGNGVFSDSGQLVGSGGTFGLALGDLDDDGDLDAFVVNGSLFGDPNEVWLNDGTGVFTDSGQSLGNEYGQSVELLDADGDGDLDAFVGNNSGQMDRLWLNDGSGVFSDSGQSLSVGGTLGVRAEDLDGDADLDLFIADRNHPDRVWLNDGNGQFTATTQNLGGSEVLSIGTGDLDGDGDLDAILGCIAGVAPVLLNDGNGQFSYSDQYLVNGFGNNNEVIALGDFDGDDDLDVVIANTQYSGAADRGDRVWLNNGSAVFTDSGQLLGAENTGALAVGDVDQDDDLDIVAGNAPSGAMTGENRIWLNDGSGVFSADPQFLGEGNSRGLALVDLDGDSDLDLFISNLNEPNEVWLNSGGGAYSDSGQELGDAASFSVAAADLDGDGDTDVFVGNQGPNTVWLNDGSGTFTDSGQTLGFRRTLEVHLMDVDGDGDLDAWTTNGGSTGQPNEVWLNDGNAGFTQHVETFGNSESQGSSVGDFNGDSSLDVFVANGFGDSRVWSNSFVQEFVFGAPFESGDFSGWSEVVSE